MFAVSWIGKRESAEARRSRQAQLLVEATRQFADTGRPTTAEIDGYKELFYQMIGSCEVAQRRAIAASLAAHPYVPLSIIVFLASDACEVAAPVLMFSPVLNEAHILRLAGRLPREHLLVLCRRTDLAAGSVQALIDNGSEETRAVLKANPAVKKLGHLVGTGRSAVHGAPQPARLHADVAASPRPQTDAAGMKAEAQSPRAGDSATASLVRLASIGGRTGRQSRIASQQSGLSLGRRLLLAARAGNREVIARLISEYTGFHEALVASLLGSSDIDPFVVFLKGLNVDSVTAMQVLLLAKPEIGADREQFSRVSKLYRNVDAVQCDSLLRSMQVRMAKNRQRDEGTSFVQAARSRRLAVAGAATMVDRPAISLAPAATSKAQASLAS